MYFNTKPKEAQNYDRDWIEAMRDSFERIEKQHDTIFIKQDSIIYEKRTKTIEKFIAIDSLRYDSLFKLWADQSRLYKPLCDSTIN